MKRKTKPPGEAILFREMKWWQGFFLLPLMIALVLYLIFRAMEINPRWLIPDTRDGHGMYAVVIMLIVSVGLLHGLFLRGASGLSTRASRRIGGLLYAGLLFVFAWAILGGAFGYGRRPTFPVTWPFISACIFALWLALGGIRSFSLPSTKLGLVPLFLFYAIPLGFGFLYVTRRANLYIAILSLLIAPLYLMAANFSPNHRRIAKEWRPKRLPRLPKSTGLAGLESPRTRTPLASSGSSTDPI